MAIISVHLCVMFLCGCVCSVCSWAQLPDSRVKAAANLTWW